MSGLTVVKCPHCDNQGMVPIPKEEPFVIGCCPNCREAILLLHSGACLPLCKQILECSAKEQADHVCSVLLAYYQAHANRLFGCDQADEFCQGSILDSPQTPISRKEAEAMKANFNGLLRSLT